MMGAVKDIYVYPKLGDWLLWLISLYEPEVIAVCLAIALSFISLHDALSSRLQEQQQTVVIHESRPVRV